MLCSDLVTDAHIKSEHDRHLNLTIPDPYTASRLGHVSANLSADSIALLDASGIAPPTPTRTHTKAYTYYK